MFFPLQRSVALARLHAFAIFYATGFSWPLREVLERVPPPYLRVAQGARSGLVLQIPHLSHFVEEAAGPLAWSREVVSAQNSGQMNGPLTCSVT